MKPMIDPVDIKLAVMRASCGLCSLDELELLHRLEAFYIEGIQKGIEVAKGIVEQADPTKDCACPGGAAQHLKDCVYVK